jgi:hypothetical protein
LAIPQRNWRVLSNAITAFENVSPQRKQCWRLSGKSSIPDRCQYMAQLSAASVFAFRLLTEKVKCLSSSVNCGLCKIALQELSHARSVKWQTNATLWSPKSIDFSGVIYSGACHQGRN